MTPIRPILLIAFIALAVLAPAHSVETKDVKSPSERFAEKVRTTPIDQLTNAELRQAATIVLEDLRLLDASADQWAIENNKQNGEKPEPKDLAVYLKRGTRLHTELTQGSCLDILGNPMTILPLSNGPTNCLVSKATTEKLAKIAPADFWRPFLSK